MHRYLNVKQLYFIMHVISISASPGQLSKLRRGHNVRIKHGEGFNLIIHPERYDIVAKAFRSNKGVQLALTPDEQQANKAYSQSPEVAQQLHATSEALGAEPVATGSGIFGSYGDKVMKKAGIRNIAYKLGDYAKPAVKAGIASALTAGGAALGAVQPELIPFIPGGVMAGSYLAGDYLDHPGRYQGSSGTKHKHAAKSMAQQAVHNELNNQLNEHLGTNYGYMGRAGLENAVNNMAAANLSQAGVDSRYANLLSSGSDVISSPLSRGSSNLNGFGLHHKGIVGRGGGMIGYGSVFHPPALASQPFAANFQFQHFLPVQYQHFNSGAGMHAIKGFGLYAGKGLY